MAKCCECGKDYNLYQICEIGTTVYNDEDDLTDEYICEDCLKTNEFSSIDESYVRCCLCSESIAYHSDDITNVNGNWYCDEHIDETIMDEEEENDIDDYIEYINKD